MQISSGRRLDIVEEMDQEIPIEDEDVLPLPVQDQLQDVAYPLDRNPSWQLTLFLAFQHYLLTVGVHTLVVAYLFLRIPQGETLLKEKAVVNQVSMFFIGINTLLQTLFGTRLPAVISVSPAYLISSISIIQMVTEMHSAVTDPHERFGLIRREFQGAYVVASLFQITIGFSGLWKIIIWYLTPLAATPLLLSVGLGLYRYCFSDVATCFPIGFSALVLFVFVGKYLTRYLHPTRAAIVRFLAALISIVVMSIVSAFATIAGTTQGSCRTDYHGLLTATSWFQVPHPFPWGAPTFHVGPVLGIMFASFITLIESTGIYIAIARYSGATPTPPSVFTRGIAWQGVGLLLNGIFGTGIGCSASAENAGLIGSTSVGDRRVIQVAAIMMVVFSVFGKVGALFASTPTPIFSAVCCILYGCRLAFAGVSLLQFSNLNSSRAMLIVGFSLFMGFTVPFFFIEARIRTGHYPVHTRYTTFNVIMNSAFTSHVTVATFIAYLLDLTLDVGNRRTQRERGVQWWQRFKFYRTDDRSEQYYSLPLNFDNYFPPV